MATEQIKKNYHTFSEEFLKEMAYKITDAESVAVEVNPLEVNIKVRCSKILFNIFILWIEEIKPVGANVKVVRESDVSEESQSQVLDSTEAFITNAIIWKRDILNNLKALYELEYERRAKNNASFAEKEAFIKSVYTTMSLIIADIIETNEKLNLFKS